MQPFDYQRPTRDTSAVEQYGKDSAFLAGGTNLVDYMRLEVSRPQRLIDINHLDAKFRQIEVTEDGLRFGALVRMAEAEDHPHVRDHYPVIHDTLRLAASRQIRNMATLGGNPLQRTRCEYFREISWPCNRRQPGSGCAAMEGVNRQHAVLGTSEHCIATYPGDFAQALILLDATVETRSPMGARMIAFARLHRLPGDTPHIETILEAGELITAIRIPAGAWTRRSCYVKVRDRDSYQFSLASAAVALDLDGDTIRSARIALGGVATVPWRAATAEQSLAGQPLNESTAANAARLAFDGAVARHQNAFKIPLGRQTLIRALLQAGSMKV